MATNSSRNVLYRPCHHDGGQHLIVNEPKRLLFGASRLSSIPPASSPPPIGISAARDVRQSRALTVLLGALVLLAAAARLLQLHSPRASAVPLLLSLLFGLGVWRLRAATPAASLLGACICLTLALPVTSSRTTSPLLRALVLLFLFTFAATRFRRAGKERRGLAKARHGRRASQVLANLGVAALCAAAGSPVAALAALAEATADTVASEIGQAIPGPTLMLTTFRPTPPGTDGGISLLGTLSGCLGALLVSLAAAPGLRTLLTTTLAGILGLLFDSLLGATLERRGILGNDLVNLSSTAVAALVAALLTHL